MTWTLLSTGKSGKREVAISLLMLWAFITGYLFFWIPAENFSEYEEGYTTITWAVLGWSAAAFSIDFMMKNGALGSNSAKPQRRAIDRAPRNPDKGVE